MKKIILPVSGMHCKSCEMLLEEKIKDIPGVKWVKASQAKEQVEIGCEEKEPDQKEINEAIKSSGYKIGISEKSPLISRNLKDYQNLFLAAVILAVVYFTARSLGLFNVTANFSQGSLWMPLVVGLVAGISTCMAMVGGLILGLSSRHAELHPDATPVEKFRPHLFFNFGRIFGYAFFGGLIGFIGSVIKLSSGLQGLMTFLVGLVMVFLGLKLIEIFPAMKNKNLSLGSGIAKSLGLGNSKKEYSHSSAMILGSLTFFLPCGFTQAMQLYAVASGSFWSGMLIMTLFALGTTPGLLGVGGLASIFKGAKAKVFFATVGLAIIIIGFFNLSSGSQLIFSQPINAADSTKQSDTQTVNTVPTGDVQELSTVFTYDKDIVPNNFTIKVGQPVRLTIDVRENGSGCMSTITIPGLDGKIYSLRAGEKIVMEFTPTKTGTYQITCAMGVPRGSIIVQ